MRQQNRTYRKSKLARKCRANLARIEKMLRSEDLSAGVRRQLEVAQRALDGVMKKLEARK